MADGELEDFLIVETVAADLRPDLTLIGKLQITGCLFSTVESLGFTL